MKKVTSMTQFAVYFNKPRMPSKKRKKQNNARAGELRRGEKLQNGNFIWKWLEFKGIKY